MIDRSHVRDASVIVITLAVLATLAMPDDAHPAQRPTPKSRAVAQSVKQSPLHSKKSASAVAPAGMVIAIDPQTRVLSMPTADQMARLAAMRQRVAGMTTNSSRPSPVHHTDGRISLESRSWLRDFAVARHSAGGRLTMSCVDGKDAADRIAREPAEAPAVLEER